jgi:CRP-like cAMP-binding protein
MPSESATNWPAHTLLGRLRAPQVMQLLGLGRSHQFDAGQTLLRQGDRERCTYVLLDGMVKVTVIEDEFEAVVALRGRGDVVGELAAVTGKPRTASIVAGLAGTARVISGKMFAGFLDRNPDVARELIAIQAERLTWANRRRAEFANRPAQVRIERTLAELARTFGPADDPVDIPLSQRELASLVGARLRATEVALKELEDRGAILRRYRIVTVVDRARLSNP